MTARTTLIASLLLTLAGCGPTRRPANDPALGDALGSSKSEGGGETYQDKVARVRANTGKLTAGSVVVLNMVNPSKSEVKPLSLIFQDDTAPELKSKEGDRVLIAKARGSGGVNFGTFVLLHRDWAPGHHACGKDTLMGFRLGDTPWDVKAKDTFGSWNNGGSCEFDLQSTPNGDLEGSVRGSFIRNDGDTSINIVEGYIFIKAFPPDDAK